MACILLTYTVRFEQVRECLVDRFTAMKFFDSTETLPAPQKHQYWSEAVCKRLIPASATFDDSSRFEGSLVGHKVGNVTICRMSSEPHQFVRTERMAKTQPEDDIVACFVQDGVMSQQQGERQVKALAGDIILFDAARPFVHKLEPTSLLLLRLPRQQMLSRFSKTESMLSVKIGEGTTLTKLLHSMADEAFKMQATNTSAAAQARFAGAIMDTLSAAMQIQLETQSGLDSSRYDAVYMKAKQFIEVNLDNAELDSQDVANAVFVSPRTLARIFAAKSETVMQYVWRRRLEASFAVLSEGRVDQVSHAAYQCGFSDLSHFSRVFKQNFGKSPRDVLLKALAR
jgi:AraC-like DNA-binding protein